MNKVDKFKPIDFLGTGYLDPMYDGDSAVFALIYSCVGQRLDYLNMEQGFNSFESVVSYV